MNSSSLWWKIGLQCQLMLLESIVRTCERRDVLRTDVASREASAVAATCRRCTSRLMKMWKGRCPGCDEPLSVRTACRVGDKVMHAQCAVVVQR